PEAGRLAAVVVTTGRWRETTVIPWERIVVSTGDVVLVAAGVEPQLASAIPPLQALLERKIHLSGTPVLSEKGSRLGTIGELLIDPGGAIVAYTVNRGFLGSERLFVAVEGVVSIGADAILVREESVQDSMEPAAEDARAEELKHAIVLPLTGTRLLVTGDGAALETPAEASLHALAEQSPPDEPASPGPDEPGLPLDFAPPATGATVHLSGADVDAILRGEQSIPDAPAAPAEPVPAPKNPYRLSGADVDAILRGQRPLPDPPAASEKED
ncbi:MAG TPA: PRC-barrel domain-containing protein, partial [Herpetosiphonaceae bacterium]|nr:PRC-barrel domain-containing protein [Herpetosiphonaceae bacterium]